MFNAIPSYPFRPLLHQSTIRSCSIEKATKQHEKSHTKRKTSKPNDAWYGWGPFLRTLFAFYLCHSKRPRALVYFFAAATETSWPGPLTVDGEAHLPPNGSICAQLLWLLSGRLVVRLGYTVCVFVALNLATGKRVTPHSCTMQPRRSHQQQQHRCLKVLSYEWMMVGGMMVVMEVHRPNGRKSKSKGD